MSAATASKAKAPRRRDGAAPGNVAALRHHLAAAMLAASSESSEAAPDDIQRIQAYAATLGLVRYLGVTASAHMSGFRDNPEIMVCPDAITLLDDEAADRSRLANIATAATRLGLTVEILPHAGKKCLRLGVPGARAAGHPVDIWVLVEDPGVVAEARRLYGEPAAEAVPA